jgi:hypothetical protein
VPFSGFPEFIIKPLLIIQERYSSRVLFPAREKELPAINAVVV